MINSLPGGEAQSGMAAALTAAMPPASLDAAVLRQTAPANIAGCLNKV
jgi:hypothetical protein